MIGCRRASAPMNLPTKTLTLPAIPIRDMVLFPGSRLPFLVGRRASVRTLELAIKTGDHLVMLTQRDPKEDEPKQESLYPTGTLALVESLIQVPRDHYKVGVKGIARVKLERYLDEGDVVQAEVSILTEPGTPETALLPSFRQGVEALLARSPDLARTLAPGALEELPLGEAIDAVAAALPADARDKQQVLDQLEIEPRLHTLLKLLEVDAARHQMEGEGEERNRAKGATEPRPFVLGEKMGGTQPGARGREGRVRPPAGTDPPGQDERGGGEEGPGGAGAPGEHAAPERRVHRVPHLHRLAPGPALERLRGRAPGPGRGRADPGRGPFRAWRRSRPGSWSTWRSCAACGIRRPRRRASARPCAAPSSVWWARRAWARPPWPVPSPGP